MQPSAAELWSRYRAQHPSAPPKLPPTYHFCDNREDADTCAALVVQGTKRATATSLAESGDPVPQVGDLAIVTEWDSTAVAIIRTTSVAIRRFADVDAEFARAEGEGDLSLAWWRNAHESYYSRVLAGTDHVVDDDLQIACETFEVVLLA